MAWVTVGVMGGLGLINGMSQSAAQAKAQKQQADISAAQTQYSPWTHIQPQSFQPQANNALGNAVGGALNGGLAGAMQNQANSKNAAQDQLTKAQTNYYNNAWMNMPQQNPTLMGNANNAFNKMGQA